MRFVLDNSIVMRRLFGDTSLEDRDYAQRILEIMKHHGSVALA